MKGIVSIDEAQADDLTMTKWSFIYLDGYGSKTGITLYGCLTMVRKTKRHSWKVDKKWDRVDRRNNTMEKPEVPLDIQMMVVKKFKDMIRWADEDS